MIFITLIPVLLFVNYANSGIVLDKNVKRDISRTRGSYKYNHPPSAEYFSVPVSVIYEDGNRKEKSVENNVSTKSGSNSASKSKKASTTTSKQVTKTYEELIKTTSNSPMTTKEIENESKAKYSSDKTTEAVATTTMNIDGTKIKPNTEITQKTDMQITTSSPKTNETLDNEPSSNDITTISTITTTSTSTTSAPINMNSEVKDITSSTTTDHSIIVSDKIGNEHSKLRIDMPHDGLIIPVAVVYDVAPEHVPRRHKHRITVKDKPTIRQQRDENRDTGDTTSNNKKENKITPKENRMSENNTTRTFPKRTQEPDPVVPIVQSENYVFSHSGDFHYSYEGGDGTKAFERGELNNAGEAVEGSFSYIGKDGKDYSLTYTADENGYRPVGAHLPTPPPIPPAIARALKYLATKTTPETITESYK